MQEILRQIRQEEARSQPDDRLLFYLYIELAVEHGRIDGHEECEKAARHAFRLMKSVPADESGSDRFAEALLTIGGILYNAGEKRDAEECFRIAATRHGDPGVRSLARVKRALALAGRGEMAGAVAILEKEIGEPAGHPAVIRRARKYLADLLAMAGSSQDALRHYEQCLNEPEEEEGPEWTYEVRVSLAMAYYLQGEYTKTEVRLRGILADLEAEERPGFAAFHTAVLMNLAAILVKTERTADARQMLEKAWQSKPGKTDRMMIRLFQAHLALDDPETDISEGNLLFSRIAGLLPDRIEDYPAADLAECLFHLYLRRGDVAKGSRLSDQLIDFYRSMDDGARLIAAGINRAQMLVGQEEKYLEESAIEILDETEERLVRHAGTPLCFRWSAEVLHLWISLGRNDRVSRLALIMGRDQKDFIRALLFSGDEEYLALGRVADRWTDAMAEGIRSGKALPEIVILYCSLKLKTRNLYDTRSLLFSQVDYTENEKGRALMLEYGSLLKRLTLAGSDTGPEKLGDLKTAIARIEEEIRGSGGFLKEMEEVAGLEWRDVAERLKEGEAAVMFCRNGGAGTIGQEPCYFAIVTGGKMETPVLVDLGAIEEDVRELLPFNVVRRFRPGGSFRFEVEEPLMRSGDALYRLLFRSLEKYLWNVRKIFYTAEGLLQFVPFAALISDDGTFLSDRYELRGLMHLRDIGRGTSHWTPSEIALFGGIEFGNFPGGHSESAGAVLGEVGVIPDAKEELESIARIFRSGGSHAGVHTRLDTSYLQQVLQERPPGCIHVLSHGFFFNDPDRSYAFQRIGSFTLADISTHPNPLLRSGLVASRYNELLGQDCVPPGDSGVVTSHDIGNLKLGGTHLVTLHACETALGPVRTGESYGLVSAFRKAGVRNVILTLWKVRHTEFFVLFYRELIGEARGEVRTAFKNAVAGMRRRYPNPYYWAGFVLVE